jgi:(R)-citramalyl-CoA lyase
MTLTVCDVGPRDGLQNESVTLPPSERAGLCERLLAAGVRAVEAASFVNPKLVPQMAGAEEVFASIHRREGAVLSGLALNERGFDRALAAGVDEIHYAFPVTDTFAQRNQNTTVADGIATSRRLVQRAREEGVPITVTLIVAFGCPFEGRVEPAHVLRVADQVMQAAPDALMVANTIGVGVPSQTRDLMQGLVRLGVAAGGHFHNTRNTGLANAAAALDAGARLLDASVGGTGGCPFAPRATGNIPTEDLVYMLHGMGVKTGIDLEALMETSRWLGRRLGKELPAMVTRAGDFVPISQTARRVGQVEQ